MNRVTLVLDCSSSMAVHRNELIKNLNSMLKSIKDNADRLNEKTEVSLMRFASTSEYLFLNKRSDTLNDIKELRIYGNTALFDSTARAINEMPSGKSHLVVVFTDGEDNNSLAYNGAKISKLIKEKEKKDDWTLAFNVPIGYENKFINLGISPDNIREWESSCVKSIQETAQKTNEGFTTYFNNVSRGIKSSKTFYTDLSNVKVQDVRSNLNNLFDKYETMISDGTYQIRDLVESFGKKYKKGNAFYELKKPELVQENKEILVMEHGKKGIWGGSYARQLLGIPSGRVKIIPGNHGRFTIFVQSTSVNRKINDNDMVLWFKE